MPDVSFTADGLSVSDVVTSMGLVCSAHPDLAWPHGSCAGPGAPESHRLEVLRDLLREKRIAAQYGDPTAAAWLDTHGIDVRSGT